MRIVLLVLGLLLAGDALAEPDTFGLGSGRSGYLRIDSGTRVVNRYAALTTSAAVGTRDLEVSNSSGFVVGELVLLHQSLGLTPVPASGDQRRISLNSSTAGRFEYARVEAVAPGTLKLTAPLVNGYPGGMTQVVSVPEYTELEVRAGATLMAPPWDGSVGGILAVLVADRLRNDGLITVAGAGFRGGAFVNHPSRYYCSELDEPLPDGGTPKGEGLVVGSYGTASGRGNLANGGGGGSCHNAGGGGGGHAGEGGAGGRSAPADDAREVGGLGGAALTYLPYERLVFGGGGGAGEGNNDKGTSGGAGGGLILIRALEVRGTTGIFRANGATPPPTPGDDGAGGGGAGGAISLRAEEEVECGSLQARGGAGGQASAASFPLGPGGGGAGGVIFLQTPTPQCSTSVLAGAAGTSAATGDSNGAGPTNVLEGRFVGTAQTETRPFRLPRTPTLSRPVNGASDVSPRPRIEGSAEPGVRVHLFLDGALYASIETDGSGAFVFDVTRDLEPGLRELSSSAERLGVRSGLSAPHHFSVTTSLADGGTPDGGGGGTPAAREPPVLVLPAEGEVVSSTPSFTGTATEGDAVVIAVDDVDVAQVPIDAEGRFRYTLTAAQALASGAHRATVRAMDDTGTAGPLSPPTSFEVGTASAEAGCGCGASSSAALGAGLLLLCLRFTRCLSGRKG